MFFALLGSAALTVAPAPGAVQPAANPPAKAEKKICKRNEVSGSRMGAGRVCKTAADWKRAEAKGGSNELGTSRSGRSVSTGD